MSNGRAPKGGITIDGVFYAGGQFLPSNNEPKRGIYNRKSVKRTAIRKVEIAPYTYAEQPEGMRSIYTAIAGVFATWEDRQTRNKLVFCASDQTLNYYGWTRERAQTAIDKWNSGERWMKGA